MSVQELMLKSGLTSLRVNDAHSRGMAAFTIETNPAGESCMVSSMVAMLDRQQQHLLYLWLQERLDR